MAVIGILPVRFVTLKFRILRLGKGGTIELLKLLVLDTEIKIQIKLTHQFECIDCKLCTLSSVAVEIEGEALIHSVASTSNYFAAQSVQLLHNLTQLKHMFG